MSRFGWVMLGALGMTLVLVWFSSQLIGIPKGGTAVLPMAPTPAGALDNRVRSAECDELKNGLARELRQATACSTDADCTVIRLDCPFACANAVASTEFVRIYDLQDQYTLTCGTCQSACTEEPSAPICRRGQCVLDSPDGDPGNRRSLPERPTAPPRRGP